MIIERILDSGYDLIFRGLTKVILLIIKFLDLIFLFLRPRLKNCPSLTSGPILQSYVASNSSALRNVKVNGKLLKFDCVGPMPLYRANTTATKEPETISWIDEYSEQPVMWDIGANVGVYSMYAGIVGMKVIAIEPSAPNYFALNRNIELNKLDKNVLALSLAMYSETGILALHMGDTIVGGAFNSLEASSYSGVEFKPVLRQGSLGITIDQLAEIGGNDYFPNIIKIDVDGNELNIIQGATKTLNDNRLKSILIELTNANNEIGKVTQILTEAGFSNKENHITGTLGVDEEIIIRNCIFVR